MKESGKTLHRHDISDTRWENRSITARKGKEGRGLSYKEHFAAYLEYLYQSVL